MLAPKKNTNFLQSKVYKDTNHVRQIKHPHDFILPRTPKGPFIPSLKNRAYSKPGKFARFLASDNCTQISVHVEITQFV